MRLTLTLSIGAAVVLGAASACGGGPPPPQPAPAVDSAAIRDSIARARADSIAREQARRDSIQRVERLRRERELEDSIARVRAEAERVRTMLAARVHFDFDRSNIRPGQDTQVLEQKLAILQANPSLRIRIVGHCDERGSDEYNLALGQRRANAAREFLVNRGVAADRIITESRGEEEPLNPASNEDAWAQNRRAEFHIVSGGETLRMPAGMGM